MACVASDREYSAEALVCAAAVGALSFDVVNQTFHVRSSLLNDDLSEFRHGTAAGEALP
jgi:hypothetical protein